MSAKMKIILAVMAALALAATPSTATGGGLDLAEVENSPAASQTTYD